MTLATHNTVSVPAFLLYKDEMPAAWGGLAPLATCRRGTSGMVDSTVERPVFVYKIRCSCEWEGVCWDYDQQGSQALDPARQ